MLGLEFIPYQLIDGVPLLRDSDITQLYERTKQTGALPMLFHDGSINSANDFLTMVKDKSRTLFFQVDYYGETVAYFWLNRLESTHAYCHFMFFPEYWGKNLIVDIGKEAMALVLHYFKVIMGMLPVSNTPAINYAKKVGFQEIGNVPNLLYSAAENGPVDGKLMYLSKEEL